MPKGVDNMSNKEIRTFTVQGMEIRKDEEEPTKITGHAAVFDQLSKPMWGFREQIRKGAFAETLKTADVRALWNHNSDKVLGRTKSGTLTLREDETGLHVEIEPPDTSWARDAIASIERGDVDQMSFAFRTEKQEWDESDPENVIRTLVQLDLNDGDVSPVTYPAYPQTDVSAREFRSAEDIYNDYLDSKSQEDDEERESKVKLEQEKRERQIKLLESEMI